MNHAQIKIENRPWSAAKQRLVTGLFSRNWRSVFSSVTFSEKATSLFTCTQS